jgi:hypothetical protein
MRLKVALFCSVLAVSTYAKAGWQYTTWGMNPSELVAAAKKANVQLIKNLSKKEIKQGSLFDAKHATSKFDFAVTFHFLAGRQKLDAVTMSLKDYSQCRSLVADLNLVYGAPQKTETDKDFSTISWEDEAKDNRIALFSNSNFDMYCIVTYSPFTILNIKPDGL